MEELQRWSIEGRVFRAVLAMTPEERAASYRLRYKVFVDSPKRRFPPENYSNGLETDHFDAYSHHILLFCNDDPEPIGNFRLIDGARGPFFVDGHDFSGVPFTLPETLNGETVLRSSTCEAGRWVGKILKLPGGTSVLISRMMLSAGLELSRRVGFRHWVYAIDVDAAERMREDGFRLFQIGPGVHRYYDGDAEVCIMPVDSYIFPVSIAPKGDV
jgi:N-acyl-L-homoserine lactone synthetase